MDFRLYQDPNGRWRWHLGDSRRGPLAESSASYASRFDCLQAVLLVKTCADAPVRDTVVRGTAAAWPKPA